MYAPNVSISKKNQQPYFHAYGFLELKEITNEMYRSNSKLSKSISVFELCIIQNHFENINSSRI